MTTSPESEADALRRALKDSFPSTPITRAALEDRNSSWANYKSGDIVKQVESQSWDELEPASIEQHPTALTFAGDDGFAALLPAYLLYLLDHRAFNEVPFAVAVVLKRHSDPIGERLFSERIERLSAAQRVVVKRVIEFLRTREPMKAVMSEAFESYWSSLRGT